MSKHVFQQNTNRPDMVKKLPYLIAQENRSLRSLWRLEPNAAQMDTAMLKPLILSSGFEFDCTGWFEECRGNWESSEKHDRRLPKYLADSPRPPE